MNSLSPYFSCTIGHWLIQPLWLITLILLSQPALAAQALVPRPPSLSATAYLLMDADTGAILVAHKDDVKLPPASLTKMMTAYILVYELDRGNVSLDDVVRISEKAWRTPGSRMFVQEGKFVSLQNLMRGVIVQSGNDASVALAEHLAGSEAAFADLMNRHAVRLGMTGSNFINATGLPDENHYTTARDLAILAREIINAYPEHYKVYSEREFTYNKIRQPNRNKLLWRDSSVDGLKTGHTDAAGFCLVASAKRDGQRLISVVMGTKSVEARVQESQRLLAYGTRFFETYPLYEAGIELVKARVWGGSEDHLSLGLSNNLLVTIPRGQSKYLKGIMEFDQNIETPLTAGQIYGQVNVMLDDELISRRPLVALANMDEGGFLKRVTDLIRRSFNQLIEPKLDH
jgi:D-alanyl-D-alanine carboxypeptidase (penicillin-binding protein 5/6)